MKVEVKPIDKEKWHGKTKNFSFKRPISFHASVDAQGWRYNVELSEQELKDLEEQTGYDLSLTFNPEREHPFWDSNQAKVTLPNNTEIFDTNIPMDKIKVGIMKGHPTVANSLDDYKKGKSPDATHYIYSEQEEIEAKMSKISVKNKAIELSLGMNVTKKEWVVKVLSTELSERTAYTIKDVKGKPRDFVDVVIDELIQTDPQAFVDVATLTDDVLSTKSLILEAVHRGVLTKTGPAIFYGTDRIGLDIDEAVKFLNNPENQPYRMRVLEKLQ